MNVLAHGYSCVGVLSSIMLLSFVCPAAAQRVSEGKKNIWAVSTNAFEWLLTIPNLSFEIDLSDSPYNKNTMVLTAKYNWMTYHKITPYYTFNLLDVRPEYRYYYRTRPLSKGVQKDTSGKSFRKFSQILTERKNPKTWRACYIGAYVDYARYAFKFSPKGIQGDAFGFGVSFGYGIPLYQYKKVAVDFELGCSLGLVVTRYDRYSHSSEGYCYYPAEHKNWHLTPFPVASELRASFVFRPVSIGHKYEKDDPERALYQNAMDNINITFSTVSKAEFDNMHGADMETYSADTELYLADFTTFLNDNVDREINNLENVNVSDKYIKKLKSAIENYQKKIMADFKKGMVKKTKNKTEEKKADEEVEIEQDM